MPPEKAKLSRARGLRPIESSKRPRLCINAGRFFSNLLLLYMRHAARESKTFSGSRAFPPGDPLLACGQFTLRPIESSKRPRLCINAGRLFSNLLLLYMRHAARESRTFSGSRASPYRIFDKTLPLHKCRQALFESSAFIYETCRPRKQDFLGLAGFAL